MYQANHDAIVQNLNYDLVTLRQTEVLYFVNFFSTFGTQAALLAGFLASSVCQVPALESDCSYVFKQIYWVSTAVSFVGAMHVLICTVFLAVYGQGLALRGPVGSMMVAVEGMVYEQEQIVMCFVFTVIFFTISSVATFFIVCPMEAALSCTFVMLIGFYYWYHYTLRIYNRFQFKKYERTWSMTSEDDYNSKAYDFFASKDKVLVNDEKIFRKSAVSSSNSNLGISLHFADTISNKPDNNNNNNYNNNNNNNNINSYNNDLNNSNNSNKTRELNPDRVSMLSKFKGIFSSSKSVTGDHPEEDDEIRTSLLQGEQANRESNSSSSHNHRIKGQYGVPQAALGDNLRLAYSGYITMNISNSSLFSDEWKRRFIVVNDNFIFYYEDRQSFEKSPENTLKRRPTDLDGYKLQIISEDVPFIIQLIPIEAEDDRKGIIFQCDTKAEADQWIAVLNTAANLDNL